MGNFGTNISLQVNGQQVNPGMQSGTFFSSGNGMPVYMQGPEGTGYYQVIQDDGNEYEYDEDENDYDVEYFEDEEELDRDGNPMPSPQEAVQIINAIPSYKFEEAKDDDTVSV